MHWTTLPLVGLAAVSSATDGSDLCLKAPKPMAIRCGTPGKLTRPQRAANGKLGERSLVQKLEDCAALCEQSKGCKFFGYDSAHLCETYKFTGQRMGFQKNRSINRKFYNMGCFTHDGCETSPPLSPSTTPPPTEEPGDDESNPTSPVPTPPQSNTPEPVEPTTPGEPDEDGDITITPIPTPPRSNTPEPPEPTPTDDGDEDGDIFITPESSPVPTRSNTPETPSPEVKEDNTCGPLPSVISTSGQTFDSFFCGTGRQVEFESAPEGTSSAATTNQIAQYNIDDAQAISSCADITQEGGFSAFDVHYSPSTMLHWTCTSFDWPGVSGDNWSAVVPTVSTSYGYKLRPSPAARGGRGGTVVSRVRFARK